ncbi:MAG: carbohydrate kinase [Spirochaetae bacterium HGW-Spirochaetae-4]|nr:MAG: carbohydrate kinase [Spirochaetae bacterium HGW-Spirochaetae-4]
MKSYFLGIDNGGTVSKAAIFDETGMQIAQASSSIRMLTPKAGHTERDMDELWHVTANVIRNVVAKSGIPAEQIKGVACTGHGKGLYLWGKDGKPCGNGIISTDTRAWEYPVKWAKDGTADKVFAKTFQSILACQPVSLLNWMMDHEPKRLEHVQWIFEVKDYIRFRLTGTAAAEITDYSGSNLLNCATKAFDKDLLDDFNLGHLSHALPPLVKSSQMCGTISKQAAADTGLAEGTPVAGGMFDIDACAIAMDITNEDHVAVIAGTWSINEYISKRPVLDRSVQMNSLYCMDDYYLIEESSPTSASNYAWFVDTFLAEERAEAKRLGKHPYAYCDGLAGHIPPDGQRIVFLPYLYGSNYNAQAKASLLGMDSHHTRAHMIRAVLEGIAFGHKVHLNRLLANRESTASIRLAGGVTASDLWTRIFCDIFELPVQTIDTSELGALGCAMAAAVASGTYKDLPEAAAHMVRVGETRQPDLANSAIYRDKFALYESVGASLEPTWKDFNEKT